MNKQVFTYLFCLFGAIGLSAQASIDVNANKSSLTLDESVQVNFVITLEEGGDVQSFELPSFSDFNIVGRSSGTNIQYINGDLRKQLVQTVVLVPKKTGELTIGRARLRYEGKIFQSTPLTLYVNEKQQRKVTSNGDQFVFLDVDFSKDKIYTNEPVLARVTLYAKSFDALRRHSEVKAPNLSNFQVTKISDNSDDRDYRQVTINNQRYIAEPVAEYMLTPTKTGTLEVEPFQIRVAIPIDFFDERVVDIQSNPKQIRVEQLPAGAPKNFNGAIGDFTLNMQTEPKEAKAQQAMHVNVELSGTGNFDAISVPKPIFPEDVEVYPPEQEKKLVNTTEGIKGTIKETYIVVPQYGGDLDIAKLEFTYFNPKTESYKTVATDSVVVAVDGPLKKENLAQNDSLDHSLDEDSSPSFAENSAALKSQYKNPNERNAPNEIKSENTASTNNKWLWLLGIIPVLALLGWIFRKRKENGEKTTNSSPKTEQLAVSKKSLNQDVKTLGRLYASEPSNYLSQAITTLNDVAAYNLNEPVNGLSDITQNQLAAKTSVPFAERWANVLNETRMYQYGSGYTEQDLSHNYEKIKSLVKDSLKNNFA